MYVVTCLDSAMSAEIELLLDSSSRCGHNPMCPGLDHHEPMVLRENGYSAAIGE